MTHVLLKQKYAHAHPRRSEQRRAVRGAPDSGDGAAYLGAPAAATPAPGADAAAGV